MKKLIVEERQLKGKKSKQLINNSLIPAVVYNSKGESFSIQAPLKETRSLVQDSTSTTIFDLEFGKKSMKAVIKDIDYDPVNEDVRHVSFFEINEDEVMTFTIPFDIEGISPAVKNNLGVLVNPLVSIDVRCKLKDLKPSIPIDISTLTDQGQTITVEDITLPEGMVLANEDMKSNAIVTITQLQKVEVYEEVKPAEGEEVAEGAEVPAEEATSEEATE